MIFLFCVPDNIVWNSIVCAKCQPYDKKNKDSCLINYHQLAKFLLKDFTTGFLLYVNLNQ